MSERRSTGDTLVLSFTAGLLVGGAVTGWVCLALGLEEQLLGLGKMTTERAHFFTWLFLFAIFAMIGFLLENVVVTLISALLPFPLSLRVSSTSIFVLGIAAASVCTIASCMTIDLGPHPELQYYKGPSPSFPEYFLSVCIIAPLLLVKRATTGKDESDASVVDDSPIAEQGPHVLATAALILLGAIIGAALLVLVGSRWANELHVVDVPADLVVGGILGGLVGTGVSKKMIRPRVVALVIGAAVPHTVYQFNGGAGAILMATAVGATVGWAVGRLIERWKFQ